MTASTLPASSPLDTLKHAALSTIELIELAQDEIGGGGSDPERLIDVLDAARRRLLAGLAEHVDGVEPDGIGAPEWFATDDARRAVNTYDDGSPVAIHLVLDGRVRVEYPRLRRNP